MSDNPNKNQNVFGVEVDKLQKIGIVGPDGRVADNYPDDKRELLLMFRPSGFM